MVAVLARVVFAGFFGVFHCVVGVTMGNVSMITGGLMTAGLMMIGGGAMVLGRMFMMFCCMLIACCEAAITLA